MTARAQLPGRPKLRRGRVLIVALGLIGVMALPACDTHSVQTQNACSALSEKGAPALPKEGGTPSRLSEIQEKCGQ